MWTNVKKACVNVTFKLIAQILRARIHAAAKQVILEMGSPVSQVGETTAIRGKSRSHRR